MSIVRRRRNTTAALAALVTICVLTVRAASGDVLTHAWRDRAGACALVLEQYEGAYYQLRISAVDAGLLEACVPTCAELAAGLGRMLAAAAPDGVISLFLGTVSDIPGLSAELVAASRSSTGWDEHLGRPQAGDPNGFVASLLLRSPVLQDLLPGYEIIGVSVEKVLVPTRRARRGRRASDDVPDGRLPYDAQLWVRLRTMPR
jgi:hypothetical protein